MSKFSRWLVSVHSMYLDVPRSRTVKFSWLFVLACAQYWNSLDELCYACDGVAASKSQINRAFLFG